MNSKKKIALEKKVFLIIFETRKRISTWFILNILCFYFKSIICIIYKRIKISKINYKYICNLCVYNLNANFEFIFAFNFLLLCENYVEESREREREKANAHNCYCE
jgi:hypothetical protein